MRQTLRDFLQGLSRAAIFGRRPTALESCKAHRPDLVLMDKCLPDADGIELTARLKILYPGIQVIVVSHKSGEAYVQLVPAVATAIGIATATNMGTS